MPHGPSGVRWALWDPPRLSLAPIVIFAIPLCLPWLVRGLRQRSGKPHHSSEPNPAALGPPTERSCHVNTPHPTTHVPMCPHPPFPPTQTSSST